MNAPGHQVDKSGSCAGTLLLSLCPMTNMNATRGLAPTKA